MRRFWDSSALVPLVLDEPSRTSLLSLLDPAAPPLVWWASRVEVASSIARRERAGSLSAEAAALAFVNLGSLAEEWLEVRPAPTVRTTATRLLRAHALRAADALQLGAALVATQFEPAAAEFVCLDARLADAARREGFVVRPD